MRLGHALFVCSLLLAASPAHAAEDPGAADDGAIAENPEAGTGTVPPPAGDSTSGSVPASGDEGSSPDLGPSAFDPARTRASDGRFWTLALTLTAATIYDGETTFAALERCRTCREGNPVMRGLVEGGRGRFYAAQMAVNAAALYAAHRLRRSDDPGARARWWWPSVAIIGTHTVAGTLNLRF